MTTFCRKEYEYYDAIVYSDVDRIEALDVLVTVAVNSFVNSAPAVRKVHRGLAAKCNELLRDIPHDADLTSHDWPSEKVYGLLHEAVQADGVLVPVATKVLHRKRPRLIPMLDNDVLKYYLQCDPSLGSVNQTQNAQYAADVAMKVLGAFRNDLMSALEEIRSLCDSLVKNGYALTPVRTLEILIWTQVEKQKYYR